MAKAGVELIAGERKRQIEKEGWSSDHDDEHVEGQMAWAAICYIAPARVYRKGGFSFFDPWAWDKEWDKRLKYGKKGDDELPDPKTYAPEQRLDLLVKAGALIAAEIDRLNRLKERQKS